jgi:hypothetical protein
MHTDGRSTLADRDTILRLLSRLTRGATQLVWQRPRVHANGFRFGGCNCRAQPTSADVWVVPAEF